MLEVQSYAVWEVRRVEDIGQELEVGSVAVMVRGAQPNAGLKPHVSSPIPGLPSLEESLSLAPNHLGSSHTTPTSTLQAHICPSSPPVLAGTDCEGHG